MFKYNSTSQVALYIQHLLRTTALPGCPTINPFNAEAVMSSNRPTYLKGSQFYRTTKEEVIEGENTVTKYTTDASRREWTFGELIPNLTSVYSSSQNYYSTEVHERLGEYLRTYRDYYGIDLMNFYNCYSGREVSNIGLPIRALTDVENSTLWYSAPSKSGTQVTCFPIKIGAKYLIKIYNNIYGEVAIQPAFAVDGKPLKILVDSGDPEPPSRIPKVFKDSKEMSSQFTFEVPKDLFSGQEDLWSKQRYLNLFIQVATSDPLRISVIEQTGYPMAQFNSLLNLEGVDYNVPFSDRLLEYLTGNVITSADPIPQNIERIQAIVQSTDFQNKYGNLKSNISLTRGRYTEDLRRLLYQRFNSYRDPEGKPIPDFLGYVDKDVEKLLWDCLSKETREAVLEI